MRSLLWVWVLLGTCVMGFALVAYLNRARTTGKVAAGASPGAPAAAALPAIPLSRLAVLDLQMPHSQAKLELPRVLPEATTDDHRLMYRFRLQHPMFSGGHLSYEWGCNCLRGLNFSFASHEVWKRSHAAVRGCVSRALGEPTESRPPFDFRWAAQGGMPAVHQGPQSLSIETDARTEAAGFRAVLAALERCAAP